MQISRGKLDRLHRTPAESTAWVCGGYGTSRTRARSSNPDCLIFGSCPSGRGFASALPSDGTSRSPPLRLASPLSPPDLGRGLAPPSCQACPAHTARWTQNAPTAPWKTLCVFHKLPQGLSCQFTHEKPRKAPKWHWETRIDPFFLGNSRSRCDKRTGAPGSWIDWASRAAPAKNLLNCRLVVEADGVPERVVGIEKIPADDQ